MNPDVSLSRRRLLQTGAGVTGLGAAAYAGANLRGDRASGGAPAVEDQTARRLAERYAPRLEFDARERWFPTDPRPYAVERDGAVVVDGFKALDGYAAAADRIPDPTVHYVVRRLTDDLLAIQYWAYSVFDQFAVNFHWHDWELLQVFVDTDSERPALLAASAHARNVPNNEFLDPDLGSGTRPRVLAELGSHSSATDVNGARGFQRFPGGAVADLTNRALSVADLAGLPAGYGLPRDEGFRLPVALPELEGAPVFEHPRLPNVAREDLLPPEVTVRSFSGLAAPPGSLPPREPGPTLAPEPGAGVDAVYDLVPMRAVREAVDGFAGPQLSFEFAVPQFAEDAVAGHLTSVDPPWSQPRYTDPLADVTDPRHRRALADRYGLDASGVGTLIAGVVRTLVSGGGGTLRPAYRGNAVAETYATVSATVPTVESVALVESPAPVAAPTTNGALLLRGVPPAEHRLTVNGPGRAPYAERFRLGERSGGGSGIHAAGGGRIATVRNEDAVKLRGETPAGIARLRVDEDFAGSVYDARPPGSGDAFGVYVHRGGAYSVEVTDRTGAVGVARVTPGPEAETVTVPVETGAESVFAYLAAYLRDTASLAAGAGGRGSGSGNESARGGNESENGGGSGDRDGSAAGEVVASLRAAADAAGRARAATAAGNGERAVGEACDLQVGLGDARGGLADLPEAVADLLRVPLDRASARTRQARAALE